MPISKNLTQCLKSFGTLALYEYYLLPSAVGRTWAIFGRFFQVDKKRLELYRGRYVWRAQHLSQYSISGKDGQVRHPGKQKICAAQLSGWSQDPDLWSIDTCVLHMFCPVCRNLNYICKQYHKRRFYLVFFQKSLTALAFKANSRVIWTNEQTIIAAYV